MYKKDYAITCYPWIDNIQYEITLLFFGPLPQEEADEFAKQYLINKKILNPDKNISEIIESV